MVNYDDLPQFLKDRVDVMAAEIRNAFLHTINNEWVQSQICAHELVEGVKTGKWTWEDVRKEMQKRP